MSAAPTANAPANARPDGRPFRKYRHNGTRLTYEEMPRGRVRVSDDAGRWGIFDWKGPWIEGEITQCNTHMLVWVGGMDIPEEFRYHWTSVPVDRSRPSGWPEPIERALGLGEKAAK